LVVLLSLEHGGALQGADFVGEEPHAALHLAVVLRQRRVFLHRDAATERAEGAGAGGRPAVGGVAVPAIDFSR
jgi:hypothetical protein